MKMSCANLYANRTKKGGRRLPNVKHECYEKLTVKSVLKGMSPVVTLRCFCDPTVWISQADNLGSLYTEASLFTALNNSICWKEVAHSDGSSFIQSSLVQAAETFSTTTETIVGDFYRNHSNLLCIYYRTLACLEPTSDPEKTGLEGKLGCPE